MKTSHCRSSLGKEATSGLALLGDVCRPGFGNRTSRLKREQKVSERLLGRTAQELQAQGDVLGPGPWVHPHEAGEERRVQGVHHWCAGILVPLKHLRTTEH